MELTASEHFIKELYCRAGESEPTAFRDWALAEFARVCDADAGLWGTGSYETYEFHCCHVFGLDEDYGAKLRNSLIYNPMAKMVMKKLNTSIVMSELLSDDEFFASELYQLLFKPYNISRIIATAYKEKASELYSLVSLYRFDPERDFTEAERQLINRLIQHLVFAGDHNYKLSLPSQGDAGAFAICDYYGFYRHVSDGFRRFLDALGTELSITDENYFPFQIRGDEDIKSDSVVFRVSQVDRLYKIEARVPGPLDKLTARELEIASWLEKGMTFKQAAKALQLSPSTVSNHLYRIYQKLGISSRSELIALLNANDSKS
ncbi:LuxR C-terminal-related transcriptional regulator [Shewanella corallii]|uniref:LuxR C-terminal-related transcriptional regulator n=1 Tax=Shewanella corallii TaxID=560080 RepID=A0ABT0N5D1_9GAMM|nr:LuxR C-terminal-related transcriptional regulator [Shewanella corallii]MCL2913012.1 LuxR C-terminal-related transcriptional regulator [Shewanella corallii]